MFCILWCVVLRGVLCHYGGVYFCDVGVLFCNGVWVSAVLLNVV